VNFKGNTTRSNHVLQIGPKDPFISCKATAVNKFFWGAAGRFSFPLFSPSFLARVVVVAAAVGQLSDGDNSAQQVVRRHDCVVVVEVAERDGHPLRPASASPSPVGVNACPCPTQFESLDSHTHSRTLGRRSPDRTLDRS
jgi:hypothetical protein